MARKKGKQAVDTSHGVTARQDQDSIEQSGGDNSAAVMDGIAAENEGRGMRPQQLGGKQIGFLNLEWAASRGNELLLEYFDLARKAEEHKIQESTACIKIQRQSAWRSKAARIRIKKWNAHATRIQRWYRGHLHREFASEVRRRVDKLMRLIYFGKHAVVIQRHFRGFYSRKYKHDFYRRKAYIQKIVEIGRDMREKLWKSYLQQMEAQQEEASKDVKEEIDNFIESSHVRVGTESCKGAFYSPLIAIFGRGRSYLEEHIKDARRRQVTGLELWRKAGFDEYGIPVKVANNKFFVKQSKVPHSKMSIDTRRRVEDAALIASTMGTYITTQNSGPYETRWQYLRKLDKEKDLQIPHEENFDTCAFAHVDYQHLKYPTVRQGSEYGQAERLQKEELEREKEQFPNMVKNPFITYHPSGRVFDLPTVLYGKIFPKRHHHTHFPQSYADRDRRLNSMVPTILEGHDNNNLKGSRVPTYGSLSALPTTVEGYDNGDLKGIRVPTHGSVDKHEQHPQQHDVLRRVHYHPQNDDRQHSVKHRESFRSPNKEKERFQSLLTKQRLSSMVINHDRRSSRVS